MHDNFTGSGYLTKDEQRAINAFLFSSVCDSFDAKQYAASYTSWGSRAHRAWFPLEQGGTGIMRSIMWYQHVHKPGSKEWRPKIIIAALLDETSKKCDKQTCSLCDGYGEVDIPDEDNDTKEHCPECSGRGHFLIVK